MPSTRTSFWQRKFDRNVERDRTNQEELKNLGWRVILIWECEIGNLESRDKRLPRLASEIKDPQFSSR
jgi:DNA mismatch endonuclease (patch repair protein)